MAENALDVMTKKSGSDTSTGYFDLGPVRFIVWGHGAEINVPSLIAYGFVSGILMGWTWWALEKWDLAKFVKPPS
jgi:hypothetical protein